MKVFVAALLLMALYHSGQCQRDEKWLRDRRQTSADQMVQNILQWLQGVYSQNSRKIRQGTLREYLPPSNTQKPRPFETPTPTQRPTTQYHRNGYSPSNPITPQPPFPIYTNPATGGITGEGGAYPPPDNEISPPNSDQQTGYPRPPSPHPPFNEGYPKPGFYTQPPPGYPETPAPGGPVTGYPAGPTTGYPGPTTGSPGPTTGYPAGPTTGYPSPTTGYTNPTTGYPQQPTTGYPQQPSTGYPQQPSTGYPQQPTTGYPQSTPGRPGTTQSPSTTPYPQQPTTGYPQQPSTGYPQQPTTGLPQQPTTGYPQHPTTGAPQQTTTVGAAQPTTTPQAPTTAGGTSPPAQPGLEGITIITQQEIFTSPEVTTTQSPDDNNVIPAETTPAGGAKSTDSPTAPSETDEDLKHPPHIHAIDVECAKDMMTINIEFNREFNGVIYSKGFFNKPECRYVNAGSEQKKYTFTVNLNSCGTEFVNAFDTQGQSYLENVLVLQNEAGIQEVWDTIRAVRCLWEGNLKESLSVALSVGMLNQEIVTFSGDTAVAKLDIQVGKGPFAQPADGLVKIGEPMTLVVSVSGDPGFDIQVKDCRATDSSGENVVPLTDENGCILKPKLFGAFQKTRETGNSGASIIAYAFFNAFKFPDVMDLMIECNIELCKTDCDMCPNTDQPLEPGRRRKRRDLSYYKNQTLGDNEITMGKHFRVILPQDLTDGKTIVLNETASDDICLSLQNLVVSSGILIMLLTGSCMMSAYLWLKYQRLQLKY